MRDKGLGFRVPQAAGLLILLCLLGFSAPSCVMQAEFNLAPDSRLPGWFSRPPELSREKLDVNLRIYLIGPAEAIVKDGAGKVILVVPVEKMPLDGPFNNTYPHYVVGTANDVVEIIEHKEKGSFFYISDDPVIRRKANEPGR